MGIFRSGPPGLRWAERREAAVTALEVDTSQLRDMSRAVRGAAAEADAAAAERGGVEGTAAALASAPLAAALRHFLRRWGTALDDLADEARRLADALDLLAEVYEDLEVAMRSGFLDEAVTPALGRGTQLVPLPSQVAGGEDRP